MRERDDHYSVAVILLVVLVWASSGCSISYHTYKSRFSERMTSTAAPPRTEGISLAAPTVGLFIGISDYEERAGVFSTPAHTLSAALMYEPFYNAATRSETVQVHAAGFRVGDLTFLADTSLPNAPSNLAVRYLQGLRGAPRYMTGLPGRRMLEGPSDYQVGKGAPVTKQRLFDSLALTLANARAALDTHGRLLLVTYISAHGWTGRDGRPYLLTADSDAEDPRTWVPYDEFLRPLYAFVAENASANPTGEDTRALAIVVLDTCQIRRYPEAEKQPVRDQDLSRPGVIVVQATSPGKYAWHWTATFTSDKHVIVERETRWGFPPPKKAERGRIRETLTSRMSVLPVASQRLLKSKIDERAKKPEGMERLILAGEWLGSTREYVKRLLSTEVADARNPDLKSAAAQEVQVDIYPGQHEFGLFRVDVPARAPDQKP